MARSARYRRGEAVLPPAALADTRLQAVTIVSHFVRKCRLWRLCGALRAGEAAYGNDGVAEVSAFGW